MRPTRIEDARIDDVGVSHQLWQQLKYAGYNRMGDLFEIKPDEFKAYRNELRDMVLRIVERVKYREFLEQRIQQRREEACDE